MAKVTATAPASSSSWIWAGLLLALVTFIVFSPLLQNGFVSFDDPIYITENPHLQKGLTKESIVWAFTTSYANFWHPLTWLSHLLDVEMHGLKPSGHHANALLLHVLNTLLVFWVLRKMSGATWRSALVAALFSLHPLHVESVAWASERKDLLSTFFWMLTMLAYLRYVEFKAEGARNKAWQWYGVTLAWFVLGLMSKPMLVTLPFVLLLLDFWPLRRITGERWQVTNDSARPHRDNASFTRLVIEKVPFLMLAIAAAGIAYWAQKTGGAIATPHSLSLQTRMINAVVSYERYLWKTIVPTELAIPYPYHTDWATAEIAIAALLLVGISGAAVFFARRRPYLFVGWFWYVGTLVPVIGIVQVANAPMADRYSYIPLIGIFLAVTWGAVDLTRRMANRVVWVGAASFAVLILCSVMTAQQLRHWRNTETLFEHAVRVTRDNYLAQYNLGRAYGDSGRMEDAILAYEEALRMKPDLFEAHLNLAGILGSVGRVQEAIPHLRTAVKLQPQSSDAHYNLGLALAGTGAMGEAIKSYEMALQRDPKDLRALNNMAWIRATNLRAELRNGAEAVQLATKACELTNFQDARCLGVLAAAYAEAGDFAKAAEFAAKARDLSRVAGQETAAARFHERIAAYKAGQPTRSGN